MRTLSNLIDKKLKEDELAKKRVRDKYYQKVKKIEKIITNQFEKAKYIVGNRLKIAKQHGTMYYFHFDIGAESYRSLYIHASCDVLNINSIFEINVIHRRNYTTTELKIISETTSLKDLNKVLVNWCRILTDRIIEKNK